VATLMEGRALAARIQTEVAIEAARLGELELATVLVGEDDASQIYLGHKQEAARAVGIAARDVRLAADTSEAEVLGLVERLSNDDAIDGVLVQLPLPGPIDESRIVQAIDPSKDVDGLHPLNAGHLFLGRPTLVPATPLGIMALLEEYGVTLPGTNAVVVGRSALVGRPLAALFLSADASVTVCHSRTRHLEEHTRSADVLVAATGRPGLIEPSMVKEGAVVVDVGITRTQEGLRGDVDPAVDSVASLLTPVPGGVGPLTVAMLLRNTVQAARARRGLAPIDRG